MPQVFVYIRNEDFAKWKAIEKKSEFIHNALEGRPEFSERVKTAIDNIVNAKDVPGVFFEAPKTAIQRNARMTTLSERAAGLGESVELPPTPIPGVVKGSDFVPRPPDPETGYPCCLKEKPCKHWIFDDINQHYKNTLTNKTRDVNPW